MSNVGSEGRSFEKIQSEDLTRLLKIAQEDQYNFFLKYPAWREYSTRAIAVALCQGAAQHYIDSSTGINDFDVYTFYAKLPGKNWYAKRIKSYDFEDPKFGKSVDRTDFVGRRVDCLTRAIEVKESEHGIDALTRYLVQAKSRTAQALAGKAVILLHPFMGKILWSYNNSGTRSASASG